MNLPKIIIVLMSVGLSAFLWGCGGDSGDSSGGGFIAQPLRTFSISGTVYSAAGNRVDSDVNDPSAVQFVTNNDFDSAQPLTIPVVLGGYVNLARRGASGATYADGDPSDFFQATLEKGSVVRAVLPDETDRELNQVALFLYSNEDPPALVAGIDSVEPAGLLTVPDTGAYFIEVQATSGATTYKLIVDLPDASAQSAGLDAAVEFVPGEVLVKFKTDRSANVFNMADKLSLDSGLRTISRSSGGWTRMSAGDLPDTLHRMNLAAASGKITSRSAGEQRRARRSDTLRMIQALRARDDVEYAQPNYIRRPHFVPNDPLYLLQWHYDLIHLPEAWDLTQGSTDVIVAVIDSGIIDHSDLREGIVAGYDFISDPDNAADGDGMDDDPTDPGDGYNNDSSFHGTHVAGTIAAAFDNGIGVAGVGGRTRIMPVRVLGREGGNDHDIARAIRWAAGLDITDGEGNVILQGADPRADIINLSLGGPNRAGDNDSDILHEAVQAAYAAGVILVGSAGNSADNTPIYPAAYAEVISVSAVDAQARFTFYSSFGATIDVAAPGGDIYMDIQPDGYADGVLSTAGSDADGIVRALYSFANGTSMSAPHVAGVAALMKAVNPFMDSADFRAYLQSGGITADLGESGRDNLYGYGLIDAFKSVVAAGEFSPPAILSVAPRELHFDDKINTSDLYLTKLGQGELTLGSVASDAAWLTVTSVDAGDFGRYQVTIARSQLAGGVQTGRIIFESVQGDTVVVPVTVAVLPDPAASAGTQYLVLIDAETASYVRILPLIPTAGAYHFVLDGVPEGSYYLLACSDLDGDGYVTNQGEAIGSYPSNTSFLPFTLVADMSGMDFITGFDRFPYLIPGDASILTQEAQ